MLYSWTEILPLFVIRWMAKRCAVYPWSETLWFNPRPGVMIRDPESWVLSCTQTIYDGIKAYGIADAETRYKHLPAQAMIVAKNRALHEADRDPSTEQEGS